MALVKVCTLMKQNREPRNKPTQIQSPDFCRSNTGKSTEKDDLLTNDRILNKDTVL